VDWEEYSLICSKLSKIERSEHYSPQNCGKMSSYTVSVFLLLLLDFETMLVLRALVQARRYLAELKGVAHTS